MSLEKKFIVGNFIVSIEDNKGLTVIWLHDRLTDKILDHKYISWNRFSPKKISKVANKLIKCYSDSYSNKARKEKAYDDAIKIITSPKSKDITDDFI